MKEGNRDSRTVASFGDEWHRFDQSALGDTESASIFEAYFSIFPWDRLPADSTGFDMGCGTGRWAARVAPRVGRLHCIDPSSALDVARRNLGDRGNVSFHSCSVDEACLEENSQDFGYCLGVLHHVPDTLDAMRACVGMLKPGAPFLVYIYYAFDNRPTWYRWVWMVSNGLRLIVARLPSWPKQFVTDMIAAVVYYPIARLSRLLEIVGLPVAGIPLSFYRTRSFYTMRTDARDRFGTPLEKRFSRRRIRVMMERTGLVDVRFSEAEPYWCAVGVKQ